MATVTSSTRKLNPTSNTYETNLGLTVGTNIVVGGTVDGRDIASDGSKLDGIAVGANNYSLPAGSSSTRGGFKIGYTQSGKNYPIVVSSEQMYVNVPWTDTNTTYSVGDGGLTQKNFTTTLKSKLDGIAAGATNVTNNNQLTNGAGYVTTNTTYSVGDGGLTQNNFTDADHTKLNGIATGADVTPSWVPSSNPSYATQSYVSTQITNLVGGAPAALDTLNELAAAIGDDASYASSITSALAAKAPLASPTFTGTVTTPNLTIGSGNKIKFANNDYIRYDDANGVGRFHFDSDGGTNNSSVQAATFVGALSGNASTATKWATARTLSLTGEVTGSVSWDGSGNASLATTMNNGSLDDQYVTVGSRHQGNGSALSAANKASIRQWDVSEATDDPSGSSDGLVLTAGWDSNDWAVQQYHDFHSNDLYLRSKQSGTWMTTWDRVFHDTYHPNADTLTTARTIAGTSFNGSANINISYNNLINKPTIPTNNNQLTNGAGYVTTDTNTTYSVGDGGLTQKNFTTTLKSKLDGIATSANNYSLPAASSSTRGGVKIGYTESGKYYPVELSSEKMFVHVPWVNTDTNTTYSVGDGGLTQKNFTTTLKSKLDGIATSANNYSLPAGSSSTRGGFKIGYTESGRYYPVEVSSEKMFVHVPWVDTNTNTTYSVGDGGLTQKNFTTTLKSKLDGIATSANNYSLPAGSSSTRGGFKIGYTESGKNYPVEVSSEKMYVNVPWSDSNTTYSVGDGGLTQKNFTSTLKTKLDGIATGATNVTNNNQLTNGAGYVTTDTNTTYSVGDGGLTQKNFTSTLKTKLDGIETGATADQTAGEIKTLLQTVDGSGSGIDADKLDSKELSEIIPKPSQSDFANGTLVTTSIDASTSSGESFVIEVSGKSYHSTVPPHMAIAQGYLYNNTIINFSGVNLTGNTFTTIKAMNNNGYLSFWWPRHAYWNAYNVHVRKMNGTSTGGDNEVTSIANSTDPSGATKKVTINLAKAWNSYNDGSGSGLDADKLDGQHASAFQAAGTYNTIIGTDSDINTSGSTIIDNIYVTDGVITSMGTRTLTLANLGYTGATNANYITNNNQLTNGAGYVTTNTTYSVGDGGLTQKNFTSTLKTKLDGIATGATANTGTLTSVGLSVGTGLDGGGTVSGSSGSFNTITLDLSELTDMTGAINTSQDELILLDNGAERRKLFSEIFGSNAYNSTTIPTNNNQLTNGAGYVTTNTTYSVGDGGLTQKNFTTTLKSKLDGVAVGANNYVLPTTISGTRNFSGLISANAGLRLGDNDLIQLGDSQDLDIGHNAVGQITNKTGDLYISSTAANTDIIFYAAIGATPTEFYRMNGGTGKNTFSRPVDISGNLDVGGIATADAFRTDTSNTGYNLITRNSTSGTLYVQAAQSNSLQTIASFRYGSATVNQGTETFRIRRDNVNVFGANFTVGGSITGNSKNFSIPHPTKEGKRLVHSCLEGPEIGVYFRGRSTSATIEMPDYWDGLVHLDSMTVELTAIGPNQDLYVADITDDGDVTVASNTETPLNYFYVVYGERKDLERLEIEIDDTVEVEESSENSEEP